MNANRFPNTYDYNPQKYADFANTSFSWLHIEQPAIDGALADYYERGADIRVLDIGCGTGRIIKHLIDHGIPAENITGLDPSPGMLSIAANNLPQEVGLVKGEGADMPFLPESFHLVTANMVLHAMDDQQAEAMIERVGQVLAPGGDFFLVDTKPESDAVKNTWTTVRSPWGAALDVFNHDIETILDDIAPRYGLTCLRAEQLEVDEAGRAEDPAEYARYSSGHFRLSALLRKTEN